MSEPIGNEIAIIGMAGAFPGAPDLATFWRNLRDGVESISRFSEEELVASGVDPEVFRNPSYVPARPVLDEIAEFDAAFFGISPREAAVLDPQQRILLETAWEAVERAGIDPAGLAGADVYAVARAAHRRSGAPPGGAGAAAPL